MEFIKALEGWGIPLWILIIVTGVIVLSLVVEALGKLFKVKLPIFSFLIKPIKKHIENKRAKEALFQDMSNTLAEVKTLMPELKNQYKNSNALLKDVQDHYSEDNINKRDKWMLEVNSTMHWAKDRATVYDASVNELIALKEIVQEQTNQIREHTNQLSVVTDELRVNNEMTNLSKEMTAQLYKDINRKRILDFAHEIINNSRKDEIVYYTEEEVKKVRDTYTDYEEFLNTYGGSNGEVDDAMEVIRDMCKGAYKNIHIISNVRKINAE